MLAVPLAVLLGAGCSGAPAPAEAEIAGPASDPCEGLGSLTLPHTAITRAELVTAGAFVPPVTAGGQAPSAEAVARTYGGLPAFCRVTATPTPTDDSDIEIEVWLPATDWNGKYQAVGNGAFRGSISRGSPRGRSMAARTGSRVRDQFHRHWTPREHGELRSWTPGKGDRFRLAISPRNDHHGQGDHGGALRRGAALLILERVFGRGTSGDEAGTAIPGRLRWDRGWGTRTRLDRTCRGRAQGRDRSGGQRSRSTV